MEVDYIIVGQGIAGTVLGYTFLQNGASIALIDAGTENSSSEVAAGIFNPVTGRRVVKTWQANQLFPYLHDFYKKLGKDIGEPIYNPKKIRRYFTSIEEQNFVTAKTESDDIDQYIELIPSDKNDPLNRHGGFETVSSGYIDLKNLLHASRGYLKKNALLRTEHFDPALLDTNNARVTYKDLVAKKIIFCEGYRVMHNQWFNWLPLAPNHGEVLTLRIPKLNHTSIFMKGIFFVPLGEGVYKVGSTYDWNRKDPEPTAAGKKKLLEKVEKVIGHPYEIINHEAGIRPATHDRRPLIGLHPENKLLGIFNGLGTKGVSIAPYYAQQFYAHLQDNKPLDKEVNIKRFETHFYEKQ